MLERPVLLAFILIFACDVGLLAWGNAALPDRVAMHYAVDGAPDGFASRDRFLLVQAVLITVLGGLFFGLSRLVPRIPTAMINVPNREHWLSGEQRAASMRVLGTFLLGVGAATLALLGALTAGTIVTHREAVDDVRLRAWFWAPLVVYLLVVCCGSAWLMLRFRAPREG